MSREEKEKCISCNQLSMIVAWSAARQQDSKTAARLLQDSKTARLLQD
jgi:hypothetical protein